MKIDRRELYESIEPVQRFVPVRELDLKDVPLSGDGVPVTLHVTRSGSSLDVRGEVITSMKETCDRCLEMFEQTLEGAFRFLVTEDASMLYHSADSEVLLFPTGSDELDITPVIRDCIVLDRAMKVVCSETCRGLCAGCGISLNSSSCQCGDQDFDERWAPLKNITLSEMEN